MSLFSIIKRYLRTFFIHKIMNIKNCDEEESRLLFKATEEKKTLLRFYVSDVQRLSEKTRLRRDYSCTCVNEVNNIIRKRGKKKALKL